MLLPEHTFLQGSIGPVHLAALVNPSTSLKGRCTEGTRRRDIVAGCDSHYDDFFVELKKKNYLIVNKSLEILQPNWYDSVKVWNNILCNIKEMV